MEQGIGDRFQQETKYSRGHLPGGGLRWDLKPETYKTYPGAPRFALAPPEPPNGGGSLWQALQKRQSVRSFKPETLAGIDLSRLLWACQGITRVSQGFSFRSAPSAGALYPVETYLAAHDVEGIPSGLYHYAVKNHELEQLKEGDFRLPTAQAALDQDMAYSANVVLIWTAVFERAKWKYRQRAYRYVYLDAGHIAQNLALAAEVLHLGSCQIAALYDEEVNALLELDGESESVLYMSVVGHPLI
jgi:SagB-type dehydrogenase family enzyme